MISKKHGSFLETMETAQNYNKYLTSLVIEHSVGARKYLDFGAGIGTHAIALRNLGKEITCIEPEHEMFSSLCSKGFTCHSSIMDVPDNSFDFIYSFNVLEHIRHDGQQIELLERKLVHGGTLLVFVPAFRILWSSLDELHGHLRRYTAREVSGLLVQNNLSIDLCTYVDSLGFVTSFFFRLVAGKGTLPSERAIKIYDRQLFPASLFLDRFLGKRFGKNVLAVAKKK